MIGEWETGTSELSGMADGCSDNLATNAENGTASYKTIDSTRAFAVQNTTEFLRKHSPISKTIIESGL